MKKIIITLFLICLTITFSIIGISFVNASLDSEPVTKTSYNANVIIDYKKYDNYQKILDEFGYLDEEEYDKQYVNILKENIGFKHEYYGNLNNKCLEIISKTCYINFTSSIIGHFIYYNESDFKTFINNFNSIIDLFDYEFISSISIKKNTMTMADA